MTDLMTYWFADPDPKIPINQLSAMRSNFFSSRANPMIETWVRNLYFYYSPIMEPDSWETALGFHGEQGELVRAIVPEAQSLTNQMVGLVTRDRLAFQAIAEREGEDVIQDTRVGNALAAQLVTDQKLERKKRQLAEEAAVLGASFNHIIWRTDKGKPHIPDMQDNLIFSGDVDIAVRSVFDVMYDQTVVDPGEWPWVEIRTTKNRWDLMAQHPELAQRIRMLPPANPGISEWQWKGGSATYEDRVDVWEAYHAKTPALPKGRALIYSDPLCVYYDSLQDPNGMAYDELPIEPMIPRNIFRLAFGYPFMSNLLACQEMFDHNISAISTVHGAFAVPTVFYPKGKGLSVEQIQGLNFVGYDPQNVPGGGLPQALNLSGMPGDIQGFADRLRGYMQGMSNLNAAIRGEPPPGVTSGKAIATLTVNALEFLTDFSGALHGCMENTIKKAIVCHQRFNQIARPLELSNTRGSSTSMQFTGEDLQSLRGVKMIIANPLMQTLAGRMEVADKMLDSGRVKSMGQYFRIAEGAPSSELYGAELAQEDLVESEKNAFLQGKEVLIMPTDDHPKHIFEHSALLANVDVRMNNQMVEPITEHILMHYQEFLKQPQDLQQMARTGMAPAPMPGAEPPMPGGGGGPSDNIPAMGEETPATPAEDALGRQKLGEVTEGPQMEVAQ